MRKHLFIRLFLAVLMAGLLIPMAGAAEPGARVPTADWAARFDHFSHPDGKDYFALGLKPDAVETAAGPRDVVFLVDTSASQTGDYRTDAMGTLKRALSALAPNDRAKFMAVDLQAIPLTGDFVPPDGPEMNAALRKLDRRVPLGSTDMEKALISAADSYPAGSNRSRAVVYIGDGMSTVDLSTAEKLIARLVDARIPVSSCPVGPRVDRQLLGALAGKTGGVVVEMSPAAGRELAAVVDTIVVHPTEA